VELTLLGSFGLSLDGEPVALPMSAQRVLAFVALHRRPLQRPYVAASLWLDSPEDRAFASLRSALWRLGRHGRPIVQPQAQMLALAGDVEVDLCDAEAEARRVLDGTEAAPSSSQVSALSDDVLPDWYEDWIVLERERYRQLRLRALDALCERLTTADRLAEALEAGLAAVAGEPLRESAHRAVIRVHLAEGNIGEALRQYNLCRRLLREQLGVEPSKWMQELIGPLDAPATMW
jgi:DNA-binding SARP family transcriptional activator